MREGPIMRVTVSGSCDGCQYHSSEKYVCQSDWGYDHYCAHPVIVQVQPSAHFPRVHLSGGSDQPLRLALGESAKTPRWCPFVDFSAWERIEQSVPQLTPPRMRSKQPTSPALPAMSCSTSTEPAGTARDQVAHEPAVLGQDYRGGDGGNRPEGR
jgi:hypothetical protein